MATAQGLIPAGSTTIESAIAGAEDIHDANLHEQLLELTQDKLAKKVFKEWNKKFKGMEETLEKLFGSLQATPDEDASWREGLNQGLLPLRQMVATNTAVTGWLKPLAAGVDLESRQEVLAKVMETSVTPLRVTLEPKLEVVIGALLGTT